MKGKIGIFDSGIGGVTVFKEILKILPNEDYVYYSDSINNPYGDKTDKQIQYICDEIMNILLKEGCKIIVIACNTASAKAADYLRGKYINMDFIAIEPAYKMIYDYAYNEETLILATKGTLESEKFNILYNTYYNNKTSIYPCIGLADLIEKDDKLEIKKYLEHNLKQYIGKVENVVLGCTHYPLIENEIKEVLGNIKTFDGAKSLAKHLKTVLEEKELLEENMGDIKFIDTSNSSDKYIRFFDIINFSNEELMI